MVLDVGPFAGALEIATEKSSIVIGKPTREFSLTALNDIGCATKEAVMIGDDIVSGCRRSTGMRNPGSFS